MSRRVTKRKLRKSKNVEKSGLFSMTGKQMIGWRRGFLQIMYLKELRIRLADSMHHKITISLDNRLQFRSVRYFLQKFLFEKSN